MNFTTSKTWLVYRDILNRPVVDSFCEALAAAGDSVVRLASLQRSHRNLTDEDLQQQVLKRVEECAHGQKTDAVATVPGAAYSESCQTGEAIGAC